MLAIMGEFGLQLKSTTMRSRRHSTNWA